MNRPPSFLPKPPQRPEAMTVPELVTEWARLHHVPEDADSVSITRSSRQPKSYTQIEHERLAPRKRALRQEMTRRGLLEVEE